MLHFGLPTDGVTLSVLSHSVLTGNTHVAKPQALAVRDMYAEGCGQLSILAGTSKALLTRDHRGPTSPSTGRGSPWPARKVLATSSVGRETRAAI
jgi:hypothetical protein